MEELGVVTELKANGLASVRPARSEACGSCSCEGACQVLGGGGERKITAINRAGATVGDQVLLSIASGSFLKVSFVVYLLPILALVAGAILGQKYSAHLWPGGNPETVSVLTGLFCLVVSFFGIRRFNSQVSQNQTYYPVIEKVIHPSDPTLLQTSEQGD
jgi:sigma-E factor negative regulatory protein RseC